MTDLSLGDDAFFRFKDEFYRVFYGDEVFIPCLIQVFEHGDERSRFPGACRSGHQIQSFLCGEDVLFDAVGDIGEDEFFEFLGHSVDFSHHHSDPSGLEKRVYSVRHAVFRYIREIRLLVAEEFIESLRISLEKLSKDDFHGFIAEFSCGFLSDDVSVASVGNALSSGQMKVRNVRILFYQSQDLFYIERIRHPKHIGK